MGDVGERKIEEDQKGKRGRREAMDEPAAHGGEQPFQGNTQYGAGGINPQVQGPISAGNVNLGLQASGGSNVNLGTQVKGFVSADGNINFGEQVFGGGNVNLGTQYYDGTRPSPEAELFGYGNFNLGNQLYHGYIPQGPYGLYGSTITYLHNGFDRMAVIRPYRGDSE